MSISDTQAAKKYASIASVAAAQTQAVYQEALKAPDYANQALTYRDEAETFSDNASLSASNAASSQVQALQANESALSAAQYAQQSADSAGMAAAEQVQIISDNLAADDGYKLIGRCQNIQTLRSTEPTINGQKVDVICHSGGMLGGGYFLHDPIDVTTQDDNGWCIVTGGGARYKRVVSDRKLRLDDFGLLPSGAIDIPLTNAVACATREGIVDIIIPCSTNENPYILNGGLIFSTPISGLNITGDGGSWYSTVINHTGNNTGMTFVMGPDSSIYSMTRIMNLRVIGNGGDQANFAEFQDSYSSGGERCFGTGYTLGSLFVLHNKTMWTESASFTDIMSRQNKNGLLLKRTASSGGTESFYGLTTKRFNHQFGVAGSSGVSMPSLADDTNFCEIYAGDLDVLGWYESGGGHQGILIGDYNSIIDTFAQVRTDGHGGVNNGTDFASINGSGPHSLIDIHIRDNSQQGKYYDVSGLSSGSQLGGFAQSLKVNNIYTSVNGRNIFRARGARFKWQLSGSTDKTFTITNLPCYSTYRATLSLKGNNIERNHCYTINTHGFNYLAEVIRDNPYYPTGVFDLVPFGSGTGGVFSAQNGGKFDWKHSAGTFNNGNILATLEIEML